MLTIGQLSEATGVQPGTLAHVGDPARVPQGGAPAAAAIAAIARGAGRGGARGGPGPRCRPLAGGRDRAVRRGRARSPRPRSTRGLRRRRPELQPYPIPKRLLVAVSHAIEDECSAHGERAVLLGSFQRERFYREAEPRWREFARTAELAIALADFERAGGAAGRPFEVPIERDHPLADEWAIVCDAPRRRRVPRRARAPDHGRAGVRDALVGGARGGAGRRRCIGLDLAPPAVAGAGRARSRAPVTAAGAGRGDAWPGPRPSPTGCLPTWWPRGGD